RFSHPPPTTERFRRDPSSTTGRAFSTAESTSIWVVFLRGCIVIDEVDGAFVIQHWALDFHEKTALKILTKYFSLLAVFNETK
ncbi:hypothetical protein RYX36_005073, partial [Vicia faba]